MRLLLNLVLGLVISFLSVVSADAAELRTWTSAGGGFKVEATLDGFDKKDDGAIIVLLKSKAGKTMRVPLAKLSEVDQQHVNKILQPVDNPPEPVVKGNPTGPVEPPKASPPPKPPAPSFKPGDGPEKARAYLAEQNLTENKKGWSLDNEENALQQASDAESAFKRFTKAFGKVTKNKKTRPKYEARKRELEGKIQVIRNEYGVSSNSSSTGSSRANYAIRKLQGKINTEVKPYLDKFDRDRDTARDAHAESEEALQVARQEFAEVDEAYEAINALSGGVATALKELESRARPTADLERLRKRLDNIKKGLASKRP